MIDDYFNRRVAEFLPAVRDARGDEQLHQVLRMFAKEIERDARHKASSLAQTLANDIHNMRLV